MTDNPTEPTEVLEPEEPKPKRLLRSRDDRMLAGVAGGLGRYFAVDPVIFRIGFAVSVFIGGLGALAYIALALFVPSAEDDGSGVAKAPIERSRGLAIGAGIGLVVIALSWGIFDDGFLFGGGAWFFGPPIVLLIAAVALVFLLRNTPTTSALGIVAKIALAIAVFSLLCAAALASAWAGATGHGVAVAGIIVAIGVLLVLAAFRGGARWLIAPALVLALPLGAVAAADVSFGDGVGEREYRPLTISSLPEDGYELGIGRLEVDLRDLPWRDDTVVDLDVDLGIGQLVVAVPEQVCVTTTADARAGALRVAGQRSDGFDPELVLEAPAGAAPRLELDAQVDFGELRVINDDDADLDSSRGHWRDGDFDGTNGEQMQAALDAACTTTAPAQTGDAGDSGPGDARERGGKG